MTKKAIGYALMLTVLLVLFPAMTQAATKGCDSFGQDWNLTLAAFGGTFPNTSIVTGCRDCDNSLGCGGSLPLDGDIVVTAKSGVRYYIWSMTAYRNTAGSCSSTHWTGSSNGVKAGTVVSGYVSNEYGPFGSFTLTLSACIGADLKAPKDPSTHVSGVPFPLLPTN